MFEHFPKIPVNLIIRQIIFMPRRGNDFKFLSVFRFYRYGTPLFGRVAEQLHHRFVRLFARFFVVCKHFVPDFDFLDRFQAFFRLYKRAFL